MMCRWPLDVFGGVHVGCGRCMECRVNRARVWQHRILLEQKCHEHSCFVTLTYREQPENNSLDPRHVQLFLKRLREQRGQLRYYVVGEYGEQTERPHYHGALFGVSEFEQKTVEKAWGLGFVLLGELNSKSARYICNYVTKGMTKKTDERLGGRYPEFARMSLKPGLGAEAARQIGEKLAGSPFFDGRVKGLHYGQKSSLPTGRYLTRKADEALGVSEADREREWMEYQAEVSAAATAAGKTKFQFLKDEKAVQRARNERRSKILKRGRSL